MRYGVVPSGGLGKRSQLSHSKELALVAGRPVIEYIFDRLKLAGIDQIFVTTHADKVDLIKYLTNISPHRSSLKIVLGERKGLLDGIVSPGSSLRPTDELYFGLPDTVWYPENGYKRIASVPNDIVLGVLPTDTPELYGSVTVAGGYAQSIIEKPSSTGSPWIWAFGKFRVSLIPQFLKLAEETPAFTTVLGGYALTSPIPVVTFRDGIYFDTGTPLGLAATNHYVKT
ncbi:MAG: NTP transferase domain-containing protein [bacterium]